VGDVLKVIKDGIVYSLYNSIATVEGVESTKSIHISIPDVVNGCVVQEVSDNAFFGLNLLSVVLPDNLRKIGARAFAMCTNLKSVKCQIGAMLRSNILEVEESAFNGCTALEIFKTNKPLILYNRCFYNCCTLRKLDTIAKVDGEVFFNCLNLYQVDFRDNCDLTAYIDIDSKIQHYSFGGNADISDSLIKTIQNRNIAISCFSDSNLCELGYNGILINVEELPF
jgi:hypothetical protein